MYQERSGKCRLSHRQAVLSPSLTFFLLKCMSICKIEVFHIRANALSIFKGFQNNLQKNGLQGTIPFCWRHAQMSFKICLIWGFVPSSWQRLFQWTWACFKVRQSRERSPKSKTFWNPSFIERSLLYQFPSPRTWPPPSKWKKKKKKQHKEKEMALRMAKVMLPNSVSSLIRINKNLWTGT